MSLDNIPAREVMEQVITGVLDGFLGIPVQAGTEISRCTGACVRIDIDGSWQGRIVVGASPGMLASICAAMFKTDSAQQDEVDQCDSLKEVANILAGNIKAMLPAPSSLAIPEYLGTLTVAPLACVMRAVTDQNDILWLDLEEVNWTK